MAKSRSLNIADDRRIRKISGRRAQNPIRADARGGRIVLIEVETLRGYAAFTL
jgi:hypothetical protein